MKKYDDYSKATRKPNETPSGSVSFPHGQKVNVEGQKGTQDMSKGKQPTG